MARTSERPIHPIAAAIAQVAEGLWGALRARLPRQLLRPADVIAEGYTLHSAYAIGVLFVLYSAIAIVFSDLFIFQWTGPMPWEPGGLDLRKLDFLLPAIWMFMSALLCWRIVPQRDLMRAFVGFVGGLLIESWGTVTVLWHYYTAERPPLWILPAWPIAALAIDRIAWFLDKALPALSARWTALIWWVSLPPFVAWMTAFVLPTGHDWATQLAFVGMLMVLALPKDHREDVCIFWGGAMLGWFLEYWGTSRHCWTYYTREIPPMQAVLAHGFASVAFARGAWGLQRIWDRLKRQVPTPDQVPT